MNKLQGEQSHTTPSTEYTTLTSSDEEVFSLYSLTSNNNDARVSVSLNGVATTILVDSGASVNVLPKHIYDQVRCPGSTPQPSSTAVYPYGCTRPFQIAGTDDIALHAFGQHRIVTFLVSTDKGEAILGRDTTMDLNILHVGPPPQSDLSVSTITSHLEGIPSPSLKVLSQQPVVNSALPVSMKMSTILARYHKVFEGLGQIKDVVAEIHMRKNTIPIIHPPSRVPVHLCHALEKELNLQEALGIIEPAVGPTPWVSSMVVVPKTTPWEIRITQDWRDVNAHVEREIHPIPTFEEVTDDMDGATVWSKLDLFKSFHQIPLHPNSRQYATFSTPRGLRRCTTLVMGFTNTSEILQRTMNMVVSGLPGVKWIHDDVTVYGKTVCEHNQRSAACLQHL